jgi:hypothetical protein
LIAAQTTTILPIQDRIADPTDIVWLSPLFRLVIRIIIKNANKGGSGISQISVSIVIENS